MRMRVLPALAVSMLFTGIVVLAGCAMAPTVTPVPLQSTSTPWPTAQPTRTLPTAVVRLTPSAVPTHYPMPESPTREPESYPSPGPTLVTGQATPFPIKPTAATPTKEASPHTPAADDLMRRLAPVEEVQVNILESFPVQLSLTIHGYLGDGCTRLTGVEQSRSPDGFVFHALSERPRGAICTKALVPYEENVPVDLLGLGVGEYEIAVNGVTTTVELSADMLGPLVDQDTYCPAPASNAFSFRAVDFAYCFSYPDDMVISAPDATRIMALRIIDDGLRSPQAIIIESLGPANGASLKDLVRMRLPMDVRVNQAQVELGGELAIEVTSPDIELLRQLYVVNADAFYVMWSVGATEGDWDLIASTLSFE